MHRQYNRDWGTSYSRPPTDQIPHFPLLQNPGGATDKPQLLGGRYRRDKLHSRRSDKLILGLPPIQRSNSDYAGGMYSGEIENLDRDPGMRFPGPW